MWQVPVGADGSPRYRRNEEYSVILCLNKGGTTAEMSSFDYAVAKREGTDLPKWQVFLYSCGQSKEWRLFRT